MKEFLKCQLNVIHPSKRNPAFCDNMDNKLESFMLSEVSQTKTHTVSFYLYVESKKAKLMEIEYGMVVARDCEWKKEGDIGQKVQTSRYNMNKF